MDCSVASTFPYIRYTTYRQVRLNMTPEQRRKNRNTAIALVILVIAIVAWAFWRGGSLGGG